MIEPTIWRRLPKAELHVHLRGAMPVTVFTDLLNRHAADDVRQRAAPRHLAAFERYDNIRPFLAPRRWTPDEVAALFQYGDFDQFLHTFNFTGYFIRDIGDFQHLVSGVLGALHAQRIVYAEVTVSALEYVRQGVALPDLVACLDAAASAAPVRVQWIIDLVRDFGPETTLGLLRQIIALGSRSIVGITLGGSEHRHPPSGFVDVYALARSAGLRLTVHAGEALGPASVWDAVRLLGVERIGHGVRASEDPALVAYLAEHGIPLEVCPTSNLRIGIYASHADHPLRALHRAGVPVTLNSDDPTFFGATLADEYAAAQAAGLTADELLAVLTNGFRYAFLPAPERQQYIDQLGAAWTALTADAAAG